MKEINHGSLIFQAANHASCWFIASRTNNARLKGISRVINFGLRHASSLPTSFGLKDLMNYFITLRTNNSRLYWNFTCHINFGLEHASSLPSSLGLKDLINYFGSPVNSIYGYSNLVWSTNTTIRQNCYWSVG